MMIMAAAAMMMLCGCSMGGSAGTATPGEASEEASPAVINIDNAAIPETEQIVRMDLDGDILPAIDGVTTAADNSELAPVYLKTGDEHSVVRKLQKRLMSFIKR